MQFHLKNTPLPVGLLVRWSRYGRAARLIAMANLGLLGFLTTSHASYVGAADHQRTVTPPRRKIVIVVAAFAELDTIPGYKAEEVVQQLRHQMRGYSDIEVIGPEAMIEREGGTARAREMGRRLSADVVVWGYFVKDAGRRRLTAYVEPLVELERAPGLTTRRYSITVQVDQLRQHPLGAQFADKVQALVLFIRGLIELDSVDRVKARADLLRTVELLKDRSDRDLRRAALFFLGYVAATPHQAVYYYTEALKLDERFAVAHNYRGRALVQLGQCQRALRDYREAIWLKPTYAEAYNNLGTCWLKLKQPERAFRAYTKARDLQPQWTNTAWAKLYINRASALFDLGRFQDAISDCDTAIHLAPGIKHAYNTRANAMCRLGQVRESLSYYQAALDRDAGYYMAWYNMGLAYHKLGDRDQELKCYNQAIAANPDFVDAWYNRGNILRDRGLLRNALRDYSFVIRRSPGYERAYSNRSVVRRLLGDYRGALSDCNRALQLFPGYIEALMNRCNILLHTGPVKHAVADARAIVQRRPLEPMGHLLLAVGLQELGRRAAAREQYRQVFDLTDNRNLCHLAERGLLQMRYAVRPVPPATDTTSIEIKPSLKGVTPSRLDVKTEPPGTTQVPR